MPPLLAAIVAVSIAGAVAAEPVAAEPVAAGPAAAQDGGYDRAADAASIVFGGDSGLVVVPPALDFGSVPASATVTQTVWVVNTSWQPVRVVAAKTSCGCARVEFEPVTLAPGAAHGVPFRVIPAAAEGSSRSVHLTFLPEWGMPAFFNCTLETSSPGTAPAPPRHGATRPGSMVFLPESETLAALPADTIVETSAWLINDGPVAVDVAAITTEGVRAQVVGFAPTRLERGRAIQIRLRVGPTRSAGASGTVTLHARLAGGGRTTTATTRIRLKSD